MTRVVTFWLLQSPDGSKISNLSNWVCVIENTNLDNVIRPFHIILRRTPWCLEKREIFCKYNKQRFMPSYRLLEKLVTSCCRSPQIVILFTLGTKDEFYDTFCIVVILVAVSVLMFMSCSPAAELLLWDFSMVVMAIFHMTKGHNLSTFKACPLELQWPKVHQFQRWKRVNVVDEDSDADQIKAEQPSCESSIKKRFSRIHRGQTTLK